MTKLALEGALLADPESVNRHDPGTLLIEDGRLVDRLPPESTPGSDWRRLDRGGCVIAPGFIDLHYHGPLFQAPPQGFAEALARMSNQMVAHGTTAFLATTLAWGPDELPAFVEALVQAIAGGAARATQCVGIHLEGPWLSPAAPGAMPPRGIRPFDPARDPDLFELADGQVRMVTLAPEVDGAGALLDELQRRDVLAAMGHTRAGAEPIEGGIARGLRHVTHLFNAMGPIHHREPGVAGHVLAETPLSCDLICDGHHVHPTMVRWAAATLEDRLVLITDRVDLEGADDDPDGPARLADGTLAGSRLTLDRAVANVRRFAGLELTDAIAACTLAPARLLGIENERGTLRTGARADLAVLDASGAVVETWIDGAIAWSAPSSALER